jgi:hypothetical protein
MEYRERLPFDEDAPKRSGNAARWVAALLTAFALLFFAATAAGSTSRYFSPATATLSLKAGNGYRITVERIRGRVSLTAFHGGRSFLAATSYAVRGKVLPLRIDARFGKFGRVAVRLKTERMRKGKLEEQCTGKPETIRYGVFAGTIRFRGEGGYTSVDARRATGRLSSGTKIKCVFPNLRPGSGPAARAAHASRQVPPSLVASQGRQRVFAVEVSGGKRRSPFFSAFSQEQRGRMEIFRNVFAEAPLSSFAFASDLSSATVQPPQPFQGEASFQRTPASPTWSGTLSVDFPGREGVRLAGPRFEADLVRDDSSRTSIFFSSR